MGCTLMALYAIQYMTVSMRRRDFTLAVPALVLGLAVTPGQAAENMHVPEDSAAFAQLIRIIDQTGTIIPGQGFKSIKLGESFEQLIRKWGAPRKTDGKNTLTYLLDRNTLIHFSGKKYIESILVQGQISSLARVNNGIRFGMSQAQVLNRFTQAPDKHKAELIRYRSAGIEFYFKAGVLIGIKVFES